MLLPENAERLKNILLYHVVANNIDSSMITQNMNFKMLNDEIVKVTVSEAGVMMNDATVIIPDIIASNGIIHAIDAVLIPPSETEK